MTKPTKILTRTEGGRMCKYIRLKNKIEARLTYFEDSLGKWTKSRNYELFQHNFLEFEAECLSNIRILDYYIKNPPEKAKNLNDYLVVSGVLKNWPKRKDHLFEVIKIDIRNQVYINKPWPEKDAVMHGMEQSAKDQTVAGHKFQLQTWIMDAHREGKYIFFSTLTVSPENYRKVFKRGGTAWQTHIKRLQIDQATVAGITGTRDEKEKAGRKLMDYFGVTEQGEKTGRLHIHAVYACTHLPTGVVDPNRGTRMPKERNIKQLHKYWRYGHTEFVAMRFSGRDVFGQLGWRWPYDVKKKAPIESSDAGKVAGYLTKYVTKTQLRKTVKTKEVLQWNTKKSRNLGMKHLHQYFKKISTDGLLSLLSLNVFDECVKIYGNTMPTRHLRNLLIMNLKERVTDPRKLAEMMRRKNTAFQQLAKCTREKKHGSSSQSIGNLTVQLLSKEGTSSALPLYMSLREDLERLYPLPKSIPRVSGGQVANTRF